MAWCEAHGVDYEFDLAKNGRLQRQISPHLAREVLAWADRDFRVIDDTILVTFYGTPKHINPVDYVNLPAIIEAEGVAPRIPWLYNFKLDFRFK
jgi:hypothetical protein